MQKKSWKLAGALLLVAASFSVLSYVVADYGSTTVALSTIAETQPAAVVSSTVTTSDVVATIVTDNGLRYAAKPDAMIRFNFGGQSAYQNQPYYNAGQAVDVPIKIVSNASTSIGYNVTYKKLSFGPVYGPETSFDCSGTVNLKPNQALLRTCKVTFPATGATSNYIVTAVITTPSTDKNATNNTAVTTYTVIEQYAATCGNNHLDVSAGEQCDAGPNGSSVCTSQCKFKAAVAPVVCKTKETTYLTSTNVLAGVYAPVDASSSNYVVKQKVKCTVDYQAEVFSGQRTGITGSCEIAIGQSSCTIPNLSVGGPLRNFSVKDTRTASSLIGDVTKPENAVYPFTWSDGSAALYNVIYPVGSPYALMTGYVAPATSIDFDGSQYNIYIGVNPADKTVGSF